MMQLYHDRWPEASTSPRRGRRARPQLARFQPATDGKSVTTGDFVLTAAEVNPVIQALTANGIAVTAVHSHMLREEPRLFFMHFWGNAGAVTLARGLRAALGKTTSKRS